jgi:AraC-like DNA-binding protein
MRLNRAARPSLSPFVRALWLSDGPVASREHVLPTGEMHLVVRLSDDPVRISGEEFGLAVVGGARSSYYVKDGGGGQACSVGVQLRAGACAALLGAPAGELAERHWRLDDLWGWNSVTTLRARLRDERDRARRLDVLESLLAVRLTRARGLHPAVAMALERFAGDCGVSAVVAESGYSHRRFAELFRESVGLSPKRYCRVRRFQRALARAGSGRAIPWADVALDAGYSDQAHLTREFVEFSGVTPTEYARIAPAVAQHVRRGESR